MIEAGAILVLDQDLALLLDPVRGVWALDRCQALRLAPGFASPRLSFATSREPGHGGE